MTNIDESKRYIKYALDVINGNIISGRLLKLACKRFINWFERDDIYFDYADVDKKINFISKFKLTEAPFTGQPFNLLDYQKWILAGIFGWKHKENNERVTENALLVISRKQGKTALSAAIMLATIMCDGQQGISGYTIANATHQSQIAFKHISDLCKSVDPNQIIFKRYRNSISIPELNSEIKVLSAETSTLDGLNPQIFIEDEACETKTTAQWSILKTGMGARKNPLAICISSVGYLIGEQYFLYQLWQTGKNVLEGLSEDDTFFYAIYQLDDNDDWKDSQNWYKSCPSLGITVSKKSLEKDVNSAIINPGLEIDVKTKQLNMWCRSSEVWIPDEKIQAITKHIDLADFDPEEDFCYVGLDIAERDDLCCLSTLIYKNDILYFKAFPFINQHAYENSPNKDLYRQWVKKGYLICTDTEYTDLDWVLDKIKEINDIVPIAILCYDPYHAKQICIKAQKEGIPVKGVNQGMGTFGEPTSELEQRIYSGQNIVFDDNPIIRWAFSNVLIKRDQNENKKPVKSDKNNKIDPIICFIQTVKVWMDLSGLSFDTDITILE